MSFLRLPSLLSSLRRTPFLPSPSSLLSRPSPSPLASSWSRAAHAFTTSAVLQLLRKPTKTKLKTHKGAAKRWLVVANGNFKRSKAGRVHLNGHLSPTRLNRLGQPAYARPIEKKLLRRLLPYA